jgi:hypothetical protein
MSVLCFDHVQVAAPRGCDAEARRFYGTLLGLVARPDHTAPAFRLRALPRTRWTRPHRGALQLRPSSCPRRGEVRAAKAAPYPTLRAIHQRHAGRTELEPDEDLPTTSRLLSFQRAPALRHAPSLVARGGRVEAGRVWTAASECACPRSRERSRAAGSRRCPRRCRRSSHRGANARPGTRAYNHSRRGSGSRARSPTRRPRPT